jgi:hypothetical protein
MQTRGEAQDSGGVISIKNDGFGAGFASYDDD